MRLIGGSQDGPAASTVWAAPGWARVVRVQVDSSADDSVGRAGSRLAEQNYPRYGRRRADLGAAWERAEPVVASPGETFGAVCFGQAPEMSERAAVAWPVVSADFAVAAVVAVPEPELRGAVPAAESPVVAGSGARGTG